MAAVLFHVLQVGDSPRQPEQRPELHIQLSHDNCHHLREYHVHLVPVLHQRHLLPLGWTLTSGSSPTGRLWPWRCSSCCCCSPSFCSGGSGLCVAPWYGGHLWILANINTNVSQSRVRPLRLQLKNVHNEMWPNSPLPYSAHKHSLLLLWRLTSTRWSPTCGTKFLLTVVWIFLVLAANCGVCR